MPHFNKVIVGEEWRPVAGYETEYEVSSLGRLLSIATAKLLSPERKSNGYLRATLSKSGKTRHYYLHRLVLEAFVGPCPEGMEGCHENGQRDDCALRNLRWDTKPANQADRIRHGTACFGDSHPRTKVPERTVRFIRRAYRAKSRSRGARAIAVRLNIHPVTVEKIARGEKRSTKCLATTA